MVQGESLLSRLLFWKRRGNAMADMPLDGLPLGAQVGPEHKIIGYLGSGGFGYTYLAQRFDGHKVALKECFPFEFCRRNELKVGLKSRDFFHDFDRIRSGFFEEAEILADLNHPNIVAGGALIEANNTVYIEMDFVSGQQLSEQISTWFRKPSRKQAKKIGKAILNALSEMHDKGVLHKDISPDNIIITDDGRPVLIDFGSAARLKSQASSKPLMVVKMGYSPQEFYREEAHLSTASDLYQLGATLYHCLTRTIPVESTTRLHAKAQGKPDPLKPLIQTGSRNPDAFLSSIDQSLSIFAKDRIESAPKWLERIEP